MRREKKERTDTAKKGKNDAVKKQSRGGEKAIRGSNE